MWKGIKMSTVFKRPHALKDLSMHYCPGCTHGIVHRLIAEVIDELDIEGKTINLLVSEAEIKERKKSWVKPKPKVSSGYLNVYSKLASSAMSGAVFKK